MEWEAVQEVATSTFGKCTSAAKKLGSLVTNWSKFTVATPPTATLLHKFTNDCRARGVAGVDRDRLTVDRSQYLTVVYRFTHAPQQPCLLSHTFPQKSPLPPFPPSTMHCMLESLKTSRDNFTRPLPRVSDKR